MRELSEVFEDMMVSNTTLRKFMRRTTQMIMKWQLVFSSKSERSKVYVNRLL